MIIAFYQHLSTGFSIIMGLHHAIEADRNKTNIKTQSIL